MAIKRPVTLALLTAVVVLMLDQLTKAVALRLIPLNTTVPLFADLSLTNVRNSGVAFGIFAGHGEWLVIGFTVVAVVALSWYFLRHQAQRLLWLPIGMLCGGACGNLLDRIRQGAVTDFIDISFWPTFNLADASIVVSVGLLLLFSFRQGAA